MFEKFNVRGAYFAIQAWLSCITSGTTTGLILDIGHGVAHVVPFRLGYVLTHAIQSMLHGSVCKLKTCLFLSVFFCRNKSGGS